MTVYELIHFLTYCSPEQKVYDRNWDEITIICKGKDVNNQESIIVYGSS